MIEEFESAKEELKRADHLIYITLKISRNVDVIRNAILRMISASEFLIKDVLVHKKKELPKTIKESTILIRNTFKKDEKLHDFLNFYETLKRIERSEYTAKDEYRKNIALVTKFITLDVPTLEQFFNKSIDFMNYVNELTGKVHKEK